MKNPNPRPAPQVVILAFEGILAPADVLHHSLEPHALEALPSFLDRHTESVTVQRVLADIRAYSGHDLDATGLTRQIRAWIHAGQDITPLRQLQGMVWADSLAAGTLQPRMPDATARELAELRHADVGLYSFGATPASVQREWLRHSPHPAAEECLSGLFDTRIGGRRDPGSYRRLTEEIGLPPELVLVMSPRLEELDAAAQAWLQTACPPGQETRGSQHPVHSLSSLVAGTGPGN